jgi:ankyrin repeat protein
MSSKQSIFLCIFLFIQSALSEEETKKEVLEVRKTFQKIIPLILPGDQNESPHNRLMIQIMKEQPNITSVGILIKESAVEQIDDGLLLSPLMASAIFGHNAILKMLLDKEVKVNQVNRSEQSAAMLAAMANNADGLRLLIAAGAKLDLQDKHTSTALDYAISRKSNDCSELIIKHLTALKQKNCS